MRTVDGSGRPRRSAPAARCSSSARDRSAFPWSSPAATPPARPRSPSPRAASSSRTASTTPSRARPVSPSPSSTREAPSRSRRPRCCRDSAPRSRRRTRSARRTSAATAWSCRRGLPAARPRASTSSASTPPAASSPRPSILRDRDARAVERARGGPQRRHDGLAHLRHPELREPHRPLRTADERRQLTLRRSSPADPRRGHRHGPIDINQSSAKNEGSEVIHLRRPAKSATPVSTSPAATRSLTRHRRPGCSLAASKNSGCTVQAGGEVPSLAVRCPGIAVAALHWAFGLDNEPTGLAWLLRLPATKCRRRCFELGGEQPGASSITASRRSFTTTTVRSRA